MGVIHALLRIDREWVLTQNTLLLGIVATVVTLLSVLSRGMIAIIVAVFGFIGTLFLILCARNTNFVWIALPCLIFGGLLSQMKSND